MASSTLPTFCIIFKQLGPLVIINLINLRKKGRQEETSKGNEVAEEPALLDLDYYQRWLICSVQNTPALFDDVNNNKIKPLNAFEVGVNTAVLIAPLYKGQQI